MRFKFWTHICFAGDITISTIWQDRDQVCTKGGWVDCAYEGDEDGLGALSTTTSPRVCANTYTYLFLSVVPWRWPYLFCGSEGYLFLCLYCSNSAVERYKAQVFTLKCTQRRWVFFVSSTKLLFYLVFAKYPVLFFKKVYILQGRTVAICIPGKFMFATESCHEILIGIYGYIKCGCPLRLFETVSQDSWIFNTKLHYRAALKQLKQERIKKYEYCLPCESCSNSQFHCQCSRWVMSNCSSPLDLYII